MDSWLQMLEIVKYVKSIGILRVSYAVRVCISMVGVSNACLNWLGGTGGKFACFLAYALAFWLLQLLSGLLLAYAPTFWLLHLLSGLLPGLHLLSGFCNCFLAYLLACAIESWPAQLCLVTCCRTVQFCGCLPEMSGLGATPPNCPPRQQHTTTHLPDGISGWK